MAARGGRSRHVRRHRFGSAETRAQRQELNPRVTEIRRLKQTRHAFITTRWVVSHVFVFWCGYSEQPVTRRRVSGGTERGDERDGAGRAARRRRRSAARPVLPRGKLFNGLRVQNRVMMTREWLRV